MKIDGILHLRQATNWLKTRFTAKGLILMYHSVNEWSSDPWSLCVTPSHFAEHLEVLRKYGHPIQLQQLVQALRREELPSRSVVVTFDDGYANNLYNARPLLERYDIPATFFITSGYIGQEREFWWDELDKLLLQPGTLPETLNLRINGNGYEWKLGKAAHYSEDDYRRYRNRRAWDGKGGTRHSLYYSIWQILRPLPEREQREVLDDITKWCGTEPLGRSTHRSLSVEEMLEMGQGELMEIGSHTATHPFLSAHSADFQRNEIQTSKGYLENVLGCKVTSFSYPHGEYTAETLDLIREAGFDCACSTKSDVVRQNTDPFQLHRVQVEDWDGEEFARRLSRWLNG